MSDRDFREGLGDLVKENQVLSENLSKCMEEKNFVWSLWKKLQTEKPDLSSVVSLVMAREKDKNEVRDAKVLNILETKDVQIKQLEKEKDDLDSQLRQKEDDLKAYSLRLHDLLIEKADLEENLKSAKNDYEEKINGLVEENSYLSEVVRARQSKLENDEDAFKMQLEDVDKEKQELHKVVKDLEFRLDKLNEDRFINSGIMEENNALKDQLKILQDQLIVLKEEHEDGATTLRLRESQLQKHSNVIQELKELINEKQNLIVTLRNELNEMKLAHSQCAEYSREQSTLIENLQSLQEQTQSVIKTQEEKFKSEIIALKEQLRDEEKSRKIAETSVRQSKQECNKCTILEQELHSVKEHNDELLEITQEKNRRISSLEKTLVRKGDEQTGNSSYNSTLETKCKSVEQKLYELQKVLELKQNELDALSSAHSNRHQRYKNLQLEHKIVLEQLKTFENLSEEKVQKQDDDQLFPRASPRSLQRENSDSVWNELQYFKTEYEKLRNERDNVMEEIDVLRVKHANDVTTIHELHMCLEDEKRDLMEEIKFNNSQEKDEVRKEIKRFEKEKRDLKEKMQKLSKDFDVNVKEKESLKDSQKEQEKLVERLAAEVSKYKKELKTMKNEKKKNEKEKKSLKIVSFDKEMQTDFTYEEQLQEATRKIVLDATRSSLTSNQRDVVHRNTQTSPTKTIGEPSNAVYTSDADGSTIVDDSMFNRNETVNIDSRNAKKLGVHESSNRSTLETPSKRSRTIAKSPIHREWKTMRQRVLSLTQQVAALKASKESLTRSTNEQKSVNEKLQNDLTQCQQRSKLSKQTIERLTKELEEISRQKQALAKTSKDYKVPSYPTEKHLEERLKLSSNECSRLSYELKSSRKTNEELQDKLKTAQERNTRQEHTLNQKKVFVEEMRSRLKVLQENLESKVDELKQAEEKMRRMTEKENQRKNQIDSLKRHLDVEVSHRQKFERLHEQGQEELRKKAQLLSQAQSLRQEAEMAVNEMEEAAKTQLHNLANQSQVTLNAIEQRLTKSKQKIEEFQVVVRTLTEKLAEQIANRKIAIKQETYRRFEDEKNRASMVQACELASSILNMSKSDIDELLDVDVLEDEVSSGFSQEDEWKRKVEQALSEEESFAVTLVQILLDIIQSLITLEKTTEKRNLTLSV